MKKFWNPRGGLRALLAVLMAAALLMGDMGGIFFAGSAGPQAPAKSFLTQAAAEMAPGSREDGGQLTAKSKKKKNTATPRTAASPTPGAENDETPVPEEKTVTPTPEAEGPITDPQSIADYLFSHDMQLPENFITKKQAQALGWDSAKNYVSDVAPGKSIGGDYFGNYEGLLPVGKGISYHEADCYYTKGRRNAFRVIYSTDGRVWYTEDHYQTFKELFPTVP